MSAPTVTIAIPVWNRREMLLRLLDTLARQTHPIAEIIAVDNGSDDGAAEVAEQRGARVLRMGSNLGFSRAVNTGIEACRSELVALVNSDVELEPDWLERLVNALEPRDVWFATGKILSASQRDRIDGTYDLICRSGCAWRAGQGRLNSAGFSQPRTISIANGTASVFRTDLFQRVGLFDAAFESYLEDVDLGLRCATRGLTGAYVPEAIAYHWGSASLGAWSPEMVRLIARNQVFLVAKHYSLSRYWWPILVGQGLWGLLALRRGRSLAFLRGKLEGLRRFRSMRAIENHGALSRIVEQREREIREMQRRTGFDWYWRVYFFLTSGKAD
jgi:GT2 family glycosyltransferase